MKKTVNFRFSEETLEILDALSDEWDCTRTKVIERALRSSARHAAAHKVELSEDRVASMAAEDTEKVLVRTGASPEAAKAAVKKVQRQMKDADLLATKPLTRAEREAKIDAFQRKMAKGKK